MYYSKVFNSPEFGSIRTTVVNDELWFIGKEIANILNYNEPHKAIVRHIDEEDRMKHPIPTSRGIQESWIINESGLFSLIMSSKLPTAKKFKHWVTSEVLPSIRKHGAYMTDQKAYDITHNKDALADLLLQAGNQLKEKDLVIQEMKPKALFADAVSSSKTSILVGDLAKLLKQNGVNIGANRLFEWLRENGYLIKRKGTDWNMPTQRSMEQGLFEIKEHTHLNGNGCNVTTRTPKITGKGQVYFVNKFAKGESYVK